MEGFSDHLGTFIKLKHGIRTVKNERPKIHLINKNNVLKFKSMIEKIAKQVTQDTTNDSNSLWNLFILQTKSAFKNSFPLVTLSRKKEKNKPWFTEALKKSLSKKNKLLHKWLKHKTPINEQKYKKHRNRHNNNINLAKENYEKKFFADDTTNKILWAKICNLSSLNKNNNNVEKLKIKNKLITQNQEIANEMNKYFANIGQNLSNKIINENDETVMQYMPPKLDRDIHLVPVTTDQIKKIIQNFQSKNSAGHDLISQKLLKNIINEISDCLSKLINRSIEEQTYPDILKISKIIPVHKTNCKDEVCNYRPISLLSSFNKVFETKIKQDLVHFLETNNVFFKLQYGFRKYHNTIQMLTNIHDEIINNMLNKQKTLGIFLDLKKAFDSIDIDILIDKLSYYGINGPYQHLISSYLTERKSFTYVNNTYSECNNVKYGVPQGSVIGPILFLLYINDIQAISDKCKIYCFADDTSIFCSADNYNDLETQANNALTKVYKWLCINKLTLNFDKTNFIIFSKRPPNINLNLHIGDTKIKNVASTKYLGLNIKQDMKWQIHINNVINKLNQLIPIFYSIRNIISTEKKLIIYNALVTSKINYGLELYGRKNTKWLCLLQKTQNKLLKILFQKNILYSTNSLHYNLKILKVIDLQKLRLALLIFDNKINLIIKTKYTLRDKMNIALTSDAYQYINKISDSAIIVWNDLPSRIKIIENRNLFKKMAIENYLNNY